MVKRKTYKKKIAESYKTNVKTLNKVFFDYGRWLSINIKKHFRLVQSTGILEPPSSIKKKEYKMVTMSLTSHYKKLKSLTKFIHKKLLQN